MTHQFSKVPKAQIQRSSFDRSHGLKTTFNGGDLIPIFVDEALPGDSFNVNMTGFARMATPIYPVMDNMRMETFFFAVPIRLLWDDWEKFNGAQDKPGDSTDYLIPRFQTDHKVTEGSLADYFGIPLGYPLKDCNALHHRAYNLIWNEWFRDQNLQDPAPTFTGGTAAYFDQYPIRKRGKRHDYFTSCLPFPQKGDPVHVPISGLAPIEGLGTLMATNDTSEFPLVNETGATSSGDTVSYEQGYNVQRNAGTVMRAKDVSPQGTGAYVPDVYANLASATSVTINELREAFQIQRLLERDARGGTRYIEIIKSHFGVTSPDARLQRPEYLGGGSSYVNINPIASTVPTATSPTEPQGTLAGVGTSSLYNHGFTKSFTEHCVLIGLISVRADLTYQQGLNRMFSRQTRYDYYWPALSHLGEQAVLNKEIYADGSDTDEEVFGYQERYAEYRYKPSMITGQMRSTAATPLDAWHLSQKFDSCPKLNDAFIQDNPPIDRVVATPDEPNFIFDAHFSMRCARPMPLYGVPGLIDHF